MASGDFAASSKTLAIAKRVGDKVGLEWSLIVQMIMTLIENCTKQERDFQTLVREELNPLQVVAFKLATRRVLRENSVRPRAALVNETMELLRAEGMAATEEDACDVYCECCHAMRPADFELPM